MKGVGQPRASLAALGEGSPPGDPAPDRGSRPGRVVKAAPAGWVAGLSPSRKASSCWTTSRGCPAAWPQA